MLDLGELIRSRSAERRSTEWRTVQHDLPCPSCSSRDVRVEGVPFGDRNPELIAQRAEARRLHLALQVLHDATPRGAFMPAPAIQLALRVLHPFIGDRELLTTYWNQVMGDQKDRPWGGGHQALRWIVTRLLDRGFHVDPKFR